MSLHFYRMQLAFRAVHIEILNAQKKVLKNATGFIMKDEGRHFLYTCWHVVTGYDPNNIQVGLEEPKRLFLLINLQNSETRQPGVTVAHPHCAYTPHSSRQDERDEKGSFIGWSGYARHVRRTCVS